MLMYFARTFNYTFELKRLKIGGRATPLSQTESTQDLVRRESSGTRGGPSWFYKIRPTCCSLPRNLASFQYVRASASLLGAASWQRWTSGDIGLQHTASLPQGVSVNHEPRFWNSSVSLFWSGAWHGQAGHQLWTTTYASAKGESEGGDADHAQKIHHGWLDVLWPMYGVRAHCWSPSDRATASNVYWMCHWRRVCREGHGISARDICKADSDRGIRRSQECACRGRSMAISSTLYNCTAVASQGWPGTPLGVLRLCNISLFKKRRSYLRTTVT